MIKSIGKDNGFVDVQNENYFDYFYRNKYECMVSKLPIIYVALPLLNENDYISEFINCIRSQKYKNVELRVCVNQPDDWWENVQKIAICENNQQTIKFLSSVKDVSVKIIDRSSEGFGWIGKKYGVGWARKTIMDQIIENAGPNDFIVSLDADTTFNPDYFTSIVQNFEKNRQAVAISVPYYHNLTGDEDNDRGILRYEIYMRYFAVNMWQIKSPYCFTAIGSAIAMPVWSYKSIRGITPHKSGEDFYLLQKLQKFGNVLKWNSEKVYPSARYSDRVGFGTGPALIKGINGDWSSYPIYPHGFFNEIKQLYALFPVLFEKNVETPLDSFILEKFGEANIWEPLRTNFKKKEQFIRACHHKIDGFRIFQYLKWKNKNSKLTDEENFKRWLEACCPQIKSTAGFSLNNLSFAKSHVGELNNLRNLLAEIEENYQIESIH